MQENVIKYNKLLERTTNRECNKGQRDGANRKEAISSKNR